MNERIGITGSEGTIGTVVKKGLSPDFKVIGIDLPGTDVRNLQALEGAVEKCDVVIHFAWNADEDNFRSGTFNPDNSVMFKNVYEASLRKGMKRVIMASSVHADSFYGSGPFKPDAPGIADSPYGAEKLLMESLGREFAQKGVEVVCIRFGGVNPENKPFEIKDPDDAFETSERAVWLSHNDCVTLVRKCIEAEQIPGNFVIIYGISNNVGLKHDISNPVGWVPQEGANS